VEHWLDCPGTVQARMEIINTTQQLTVNSKSVLGKLVALVTGEAYFVTSLVRTPSTTAAAVIVAEIVEVAA